MMVSLSEQPAQPESSEWPRAVHWLELYLPYMPDGVPPSQRCVFSFSRGAANGERRKPRCGEPSVPRQAPRPNRKARRQCAPVSFGEQVLLDVFQTLVTMGRPDMWIVQR